MITLSTIVYEKKLDDILSTDSWFFKFKSDFITAKLLIISNVLSVDITLQKISELSQYHNFDVIWVKDVADEVNYKYNLSTYEDDVGYWHTIPFFVGIDSTNTKFLFSVAADCMNDIFIDDDFLKHSIEELEHNSLCLTTTVEWDRDRKNGFDCILGEYEQGMLLNSGIDIPQPLPTNFTYTSTFGDSVWLGITNTLKSIDYNVDTSHVPKYLGPSYGGNCFEKRMFHYMNFNKVYRCISKGRQYYIHNGKYWNSHYPYVTEDSLRNLIRYESRKNMGYKERWPWVVN